VWRPSPAYAAHHASYEIIGSAAVWYGGELRERGLRMRINATRVNTEHTTTGGRQAAYDVAAARCAPSQRSVQESLRVIRCLYGDGQR